MANLFWKIRYLDRSDKQFKDRILELNMDQLAPELAAAIEFSLDASKYGVGIVRYRQLFHESTEDAVMSEDGLPRIAFVPEYFEDDAGNRISDDEMAVIVTCDPSARTIPHGAQQHDIDFMLSIPEPLPIDAVHLSTDEVTILGYFKRDHRELLTSVFMRQGQFTLNVIV